jgi:phosphatidylserine decarboxylase
MKSLITRMLLRLMPKRTYTVMLGSLTRTRWSARLIPWYMGHFGISEEDLNIPAHQHPTLGEFFTRKLAPGARPLGSGIVSPVDGTVSEGGLIQGDRLLQIKGREYTVGQLFADRNVALQYEGGHYLTLYLSPRDYHRIHAPLDCVAKKFVHVPGTLFPVNEYGLNHVPGLFVRNERVITYFSSGNGPFALVKVGAAGVGSVVVPHGPRRNGRDRYRGKIEEMACEVPYCKGDEVGYFALGSTVVLLFPKSISVQWDVKWGDVVRMGQTVGRMT